MAERDTAPGGYTAEDIVRAFPELAPEFIRRGLARLKSSRADRRRPPKRVTAESLEIARNMRSSKR